MQTGLTLKQRLLSLLIYIIALILLSGFVTGMWIPTEGGKSLWFYSSIGLFFFTRLTSPFFVTPKDSLANSATAALLLATIDMQYISILQNELNVFRWIAFGYATLITLTAIIAISLFQVDQLKNPRLSLLSGVSYRLSDYLGRGQLVFTPLVLISIFGFYQGEMISQLWLLLFWALLVFIEPVDLIIKIIDDINLFASNTQEKMPVGEIQRIDDPKIIRVRLSTTETWKRNRIHIAKLPDSRQVEVIPLFTQTQNSELIGTGFYHDKPPVSLQHINSGYIYWSSNARSSEEVLSELCGSDVPAELIGFIVEDSTISQIRFEVASEVELQEGWLVFAREGEFPVYYQIIDARTEEENFSQNPRGTHIVLAQQLGILDSQKGFIKYGWLPLMNSPVFFWNNSARINEAVPVPDHEFELGKIPHSNIPLKAQFNDMLEYHTAILGATGTGKTELAFDIIRKAISNQTKVFCVDFTGEYFPRLSDCNPIKLGLDETQAKELQKRLFDVETGQFSAGDERRALEKFVNEIRPGIEKQVDQFLQPEDASLGIFELEEIANTKATLRATELYLSTLFKWARENRKGRKILLVLEEAHTIIPEMNLFGHDRVETGAVVGRMAQIALQGRKYGVGLLLISQRTALVSKSLLSQCNTVLAFAMHDETGLNYLTTVFNSEHVSAIPNLKFLQAIAFGKAIKSDRPIIFEIPEDDEKRKAAEALTVTIEGVEETANSQQNTQMPESKTASSSDDDVPF